MYTHPPWALALCVARKHIFLVIPKLNTELDLLTSEGGLGSGFTNSFSEKQNKMKGLGTFISYCRGHTHNLVQRLMESLKNFLSQNLVQKKIRPRRMPQKNYVEAGHIVT